MTESLSVTETLTLTAKEEVRRAASNEESDDDDCWEPFRGLCWWVVVAILSGGGLSCAAAGAYIYVKTKKDKDPEEQAATGNQEESFDHFAKMADDTPDLVLAAQGVEPQLDAKEMSVMSSPLSTSKSPELSPKSSRFSPKAQTRPTSAVSSMEDPLLLSEYGRVDV